MDFKMRDEFIEPEEHEAPALTQILLRSKFMLFLLLTSKV
jgi:hypothetical protein